MDDAVAITTPPVAEKSKSLFDDFMRYLTHRRKQLQDWDAAPPYFLGFLIFILSALDLSVSLLLLQKSPFWPAILKTTFLISILFAAAGYILARLARELADHLNKKGRFTAVIAFFNIGLWPFLLFLPVVLLLVLRGGMDHIAALFLILLCLQVLSNWRESMEIVFELTRIQSALVIYGSGLMLAFLSGLIIYGSIFRELNSLLGG